MDKQLTRSINSSLAQLLIRSSMKRRFIGFPQNCFHSVLDYRFISHGIYCYIVNLVNSNYKLSRERKLRATEFRRSHWE